MRTIESAKKDCYAAWAAQPNATHGWCIHHEMEFEPLTEPIANRIGFILSSKSRGEQVCRLDNMRPVSSASFVVVRPAWKAYEEATAPAWKAREEALATALKAYEEAAAPAHRQDVPNHTWNGKSIFKK